MPLPPIHGLRAELVPHRHWPLRQWFYASPIWFYHRPRGEERIVANHRFYELVDPDLREICYRFHQHGLLTTPSCQGHFYERPRFERIWAELRREAERIASAEGLVVRDSETDRPYRFRDERFELPWKDPDAFCAEAMGHQSTGYLGVIVPPERPEVLTRFMDGGFCDEKAEFGHTPEVGRRLGGELFTCLVRPGDPTERMELWRIVTERIGRLLDEPIRPDDAAGAGARHLAPSRL
jgi:hypothetical protein